MKKIILTFVVLLLVSATAFAADLVGSKNSDKYHKSTCPLAQKIKPENMVKFDSAADAVKAGYAPCKRCNPPVAQNIQK